MTRVSAVIFKEDIEFVNRKTTMIRSPTRKPTVAEQAKTKEVLSNIKQDDSAFAEYMAQLKIEDDDYFKFNGKTFKTILNNYLKCLKICEEIIADMQTQGKKYWDDPELGPQSTSLK